MTKLGYVEGQNIVYDVQKEYVDQAVQQQILKKFVADKVDLIFVFPTEASVMAKEATQGTNIPVLFANAFLEGSNLVKSVPEPGGNITGVRYPAESYLHFNYKQAQYYGLTVPEGILRQAVEIAR